MCAQKDFTCRYHKRYTRGYEKRGDYWDPLAALFVDKVAIRNDIMEKHLGEDDFPENEAMGDSTRIGIDQSAMGIGGKSECR